MNRDLSVIGIEEAEKKVIKKFKRTFIINAVTKYGDIYKVKIARRSKRQSVLNCPKINYMCLITKFIYIWCVSWHVLAL